MIRLSAYLEIFFFNCEVFEDVENNTEEGEEDSVEEMLKVEMLFEFSKVGISLFKNLVKLNGTSCSSSV